MLQLEINANDAEMGAEERLVSSRNNSLFLIYHIGMHMLRKEDVYFCPPDNRSIVLSLRATGTLICPEAATTVPLTRSRQ